MRVFFGKIIRNMFSKKFWGLKPGSALGRWKLYYWCSEKLCNISRKTPVLEFLFNKIVGLKFCESLVVINFKEISFLTIINFKNANWPLDPVGGAYSPPPRAVLISLRTLRSGFFARLRRSSSFFINFCSHAC